MTTYLLIGGPRHGELLTIKGGNKIIYSEKGKLNMIRHLYVCTVFFLDGLYYDFAIWDQELLEDTSKKYDLPRLITESGLEAHPQ